VDFTLDFIACSGAETVNVTTNSWKGEQAQLNQGAVDSDTDLILISIGGNDAYFSTLIKACLKSPNCKNAKPNGIEATWRNYLPSFIHNTVYTRLVSTYTSIKTATAGDNASVIALLYARPLVGETCSATQLTPLARIDAEEQMWLKDMTDLLNATIIRAADDAGIQWVSAFGDLLHHASCEQDSYFTRIRATSKDNKNASLHPTAAGHAAYAAAIQRYIENPAKYVNGAYASGMPRNP